MSILKKPKHLTAVGSPMTLEFSLSLPCDYMSSPLLRTWMSDSLSTFLQNPYANNNLRWGLQDGLGLDNVPRMGLYGRIGTLLGGKDTSCIFSLSTFKHQRGNVSTWGQSSSSWKKSSLVIKPTDLFSLPEYEKLMSVSTNPFIVLCCGSLGWNLKDGSFVYQHASPHDLLCTELSTESAKGRARLCI